MKHTTLFLMGLYIIFNLYSIQAQDYNLEASSYFNDSSDGDAVKSARILSDGTIILAANTTNNYGKTPITLNGAGASSKGAVVRLSSDGATVLSITRIGDEVYDMAIDDNNNIYVALGSQGFVKLNSAANTVVYQKDNNGYCGRVDVSPNGTVAALQGDGGSTGNIYVYNGSGNSITNFKGKNFTSDVAIDQANRLVFITGFVNSNSGCNPVQISYLLAHDFNGNRVWKNYDHSGRDLETCNGPSVENNMADTRGYRVVSGPDGNIYAAFEVAGGNHIFRRHPRDLKTAVPVVGGDKYHQFYNSRSEHKSFIGIYNPKNGDYLKGQQFSARLENGRANALRLRRGDFTVGPNGNVYIAFTSASGGGSGNRLLGLPYDFSPSELSSGYGGGPTLMVMSPDLKDREFVARVSGNGDAHTVAVRTIGGEQKIVLAGLVDSGEPFFGKNAIDNSPDGGSGNGFFSVFTTAAVSPVNIVPSVSLTSPSGGATFIEGANINITANASDSDGTVTKVEFYQGSTKLGEDTSSPYSYSWNNVQPGSYSLTAKATDNEGATTTSSTVNITVNSSGGGTTEYFVESGGILSIEAEHFDGSVAGSGSTSGSSLEVFTDTNASNGEGIRATPNTGVNAGATTNGPGYTYDVYFNTTGTYKVWIRMLGAGGGDDSWHIGLDGTLLTGGGYGLGDTQPNWTWVNDVMAGPTGITMNVTTPGAHTINVWMREDGAQLDKLVFTQGAVPTGAGPAESPRGDGSGTPNVAPVVSLTAPANAATFTEGNSINITADASDSDGSVDKVEFYQGSTKLGEDTSSPYNYTWNNAQVGSYTLTAKAIDDKGAETTSSGVSVTVEAAPSGSCVAGENLTQNNGVTIEGVTQQSSNPPANMIDNNTADGSRWSIQAFPTVGVIDLQEIQSIDGVALFPYQDRAYQYRIEISTDGINYTQVVDRSGNTASGNSFKDSFTTMQGRYVRLTVEDCNCSTGWSSINELKVYCAGDGNAGTAPVVSITSPSNNAIFTKGDTINISANASDSDGTVTQVEFFNGSTSLGIDSLSPYNVTISNASEGNYSFTAVATDNEGLSTTSSVITVKVNASGGNICGSSSGGPTDNPVESAYPGEYTWAKNIKWNCVFNVNDYSGSAMDKFKAAQNDAVANGGGVVYFPSGTYTFTNDIYIKSGVVIRGANFSSDDAKKSNFDPATNFEFPKYSFKESGSGSPNSSAFKFIRLDDRDANSASNVGVVNIDINRAGIELSASNKSGASGENMVVYGVRTNNVAKPAPNVPNSSRGQKAYQRYSYRFAYNILAYNKKNILIANTRHNDKVTDNYSYKSYVVSDGGSTKNLKDGKAIFNYTDHYGIEAGQGNGRCSGSTPSNCPENFREGIIIRDNWVYHTMRTAILARGQGLRILNNVIRDKSGKTIWVHPTGDRLTGNSTTHENRAIDWAGWDVKVNGNDYEVYRHKLKDTPYLSVDGEGILIQECCGGTVVNGAEITDNFGPKTRYIGIYKTRDVKDLVIRNNVVNDGNILMWANTNGGSYKAENVVIENNTVSGDISFQADKASGSGNVIRNNKATRSNSKIKHSCAANVQISGNTGFNVSSCESFRTRSAHAIQGTDNILSKKPIVYPNPSIGVVNIQGVTKNTVIKVYNTFGVQILSVKGQEVIDLTQEMKGMYLVRIIDENSSIVKTVVIK